MIASCELAPVFTTESSNGLLIKLIRLEERLLRYGIAIWSGVLPLNFVVNPGASG